MSWLPNTHVLPGFSAINSITRDTSALTVSVRSPRSPRKTSFAAGHSGSRRSFATSLSSHSTRPCRSPIAMTGYSTRAGNSIGATSRPTRPAAPAHRAGPAGRLAFPGRAGAGKVHLVILRVAVGPRSGARHAGGSVRADHGRPGGHLLPVVAVAVRRDRAQAVRRPQGGAPRDARARPRRVAGPRHRPEGVEGGGAAPVAGAQGVAGGGVRRRQGRAAELAVAAGG